MGTVLSNAAVILGRTGRHAKIIIMRNARIWTLDRHFYDRDRHVATSSKVYRATACTVMAISSSNQQVQKHTKST